MYVWNDYHYKAFLLLAFLFINWPKPNINCGMGFAGRCDKKLTTSTGCSSLCLHEVIFICTRDMGTVKYGDCQMFNANDLHYASQPYNTFSYALILFIKDKNFLHSGMQLLLLEMGFSIITGN